jgi:hypothetical protein
MEAALEKGKFGRPKAYQLINDGKIVAYKMDQRPWSTPTASTLVTRRLTGLNRAAARADRSVHA